MTRGLVTRRGVLALVGTAATAGCSEIRAGVSGDRSTRIDGADVRSATEGDVPAVPRTVPVGIEGSYLEGRADRARRLLSGVPTPLDREEVPNGAIREELAAMHQGAREALAAAGDAGSPYEAMESLRSARGHAGALDAAWRAIDADLTREALLGDAEAIRRDVRNFRDGWRYAGTDPIRAVLVSAPVEEAVRRAMARASVDAAELRTEEENPVTVGELGGDLERARALLDDGTYLRDRYLDSLADAPGLGSTLRSAAGSLVSAARERRRGLPEYDPDDPSASVGRDVEETPAAWALRDLYDRATYLGRIGDERSDGRLATAVLLAGERLADLRAFESLHGRVAGGETFAVDGASDVESIRSAAVRAVEAALADAGHPRLARRALADPAAMIRFADRELRDVRDEVEARWIAREVGEYVTAAATARGVPRATERVAAALEGAA